ncbi:MAG TPA: guanosine-3',5'-bis(diphosphate) 3'-diphosphatase [Xanthomonadales bacterium]|nr:guanosine-3',5'-bis(diphosphate) 3'-diphosphatase [Xanthomonadales bacterium]
MASIETVSDWYNPTEIDSRSLPAYFRALESRIESQLPSDQVARVRRAYLIAAEAHSGQTRKSGEPYITHPVAVAAILSELGLDAETLCAAILHDALEDTSLARSTIEREFGTEVAELVDGVTKLDKLRFGSRQEAAAESFRKMMLAMARDLRVILIKLADRLHNMRTLDAMDTGARRRIALETLEIYAPIAQRLGMNKFKAELQDLGFRALYPRRYAVISKRIRSQPGIRREKIAKIETHLGQRLSQENLPFRLVSRVKSAWSIFNKMKTDARSLDQVMDVFGFRVVVADVMQCYHALGAVHAAYKPVESRFRDFIAIPKANGYQSLHTVLFGPYGTPIEVQIRTEEMDLIAERGIAAHWSYKSGEAGAGNSAQTRAQNWVRSLIDSQQSAGSSLEFLENVKIDLFPDEVYVFTPKGEIMALPRNSTVLDFAYSVHTDVGDHAVTSRIDGKLMPLRSRLESGQTIEIITAPSASPDPHWLEFAGTSKARTAIRHFLKRLEHEDAVELGHRMLDRALEQLGKSLEQVPQRRVDRYLGQNRYRRLEELLADIALGNRMPAQVARELSRSRAEAQRSDAVSDKILISGSERSVLTFGTCCRPIPGDEIMGYLSAGKGIVVHRAECGHVPEYRRTPERCVEMGWDRQVQGDYRAALRVQVQNKPGVLAQVAAAIGAAGSNIETVEYRERDVGVAVIDFVIEVRERRHLAEVIRRIRRLGVVSGVQRL